MVGVPLAGRDPTPIDLRVEGRPGLVEQAVGPAGVACLHFVTQDRDGVCELAGLCDDANGLLFYELNELNTPVIRGAIDVAGN